MAEKERKTIRVIEHENIDGSSTSSINSSIEKHWIFGWDLENIKTQVRKSKSREGYVSYFGSFADCIFVRNQTIQHYAELVALEKEYEKSFYSSSYYVPCPIKVKSNLSWGILTTCILIVPIILAVLFFLHNVTSALAGFIILTVPVGFIVTIVRVIMRILLMKKVHKDKKNYAMGGSDYSAKYALYKEASDKFENNQTKIYQEARELTKSDNLRLPLQASLDVWRKMLSDLDGTPWQSGEPKPF
jgi:hypothetical protein